jgi:hypothetical protein
MPSEAPYVTSSDPCAPTLFTDVLVLLKVNQFMQSLLSAPAKRAERANPSVVAKVVQMFKEEVIDTLHPALRLETPDTSWDNMISTMPLKRAEAHIVIYGVLQGWVLSSSRSSLITETNAASISRRWLLAHDKPYSRLTLRSNAQKLHWPTHPSSLRGNRI